MKNRLYGVLIALAFVPFAGCGDDTAGQDMTISPDLSGTARDMTAGRDMTAAATTCLTIATCAAGCGTSACITACVAAGATASQAKYQDLITCGVSHCLAGDGGTMSADGGAGSCSSAADMSAGCITCIKAKAQSAACSTEFNACLSG